jgi:hypothetical protein
MANVVIESTRPSANKSRWMQLRPARCSFRQVSLSFVHLAEVIESLLVAHRPDGLLGGLLVALMLAIAITDFRGYIIQNELTATALALAPRRHYKAERGLAWSALGGLRGYGDRRAAAAPDGRQQARNLCGD